MVVLLLLLMTATTKHMVKVIVVILVMVMMRRRVMIEPHQIGHKIIVFVHFGHRLFWVSKRAFFLLLHCSSTTARRE